MCHQLPPKGCGDARSANAEPIAADEHVPAGAACENATRRSGNAYGSAQTGAAVSVQDLARFAETFADLADDDVMSQA